MTRKIIFTVVAAILMAGSTAHAEFIIDAFHTTDVENDGLATTISSNNVQLEIITDEGPLPTFPSSLSPITVVEGIGSAGGDVYVWEAELGHSIEFLYTWTGVFDDLQSISGLQLEEIPVQFSALDDWALEINGNAVGVNNSGILDTTLALDSLTQLSLKFTSNGNNQELNFGGEALFATPEPTSLLMLGGVGAVALLRRRKR